MPFEKILKYVFFPAIISFLLGPSAAEKQNNDSFIKRDIPKRRGDDEKGRLCFCS